MASMALGPNGSQVVHGRPFEVLTPKVHQTFARLGVESFVGTEEGPVLPGSDVDVDVKVATKVTKKGDFGNVGISVSMYS